HSLPDLLQVRGRQPAGEPQAQYRGRPGLLQQAGRADTSVDRDRRRAVGECACVRLQADRARVQGLMVKISYEQKPNRRSLIQAWGAEIVPSPSEETQAGRAILEEHPDSPGSLGIAISEAVEDAAGREDTAYSLGSVLNHVLLHQT